MTKPKLKIAVFHLAFVYSGGGEKLVIEEVKGLRKKGHQVDCFVPFIDETACFPDILPGLGVREVIPWASRLFSWRPMAVLLLTCALAPFYVWRFRNYDVLLGANQPGPWFCYLIHRFYKIPYIIYLSQPTRILYPRKVDVEVGLRFRGKLNFLLRLANYFRPLIWWADRTSIREAKTMLADGEYMGEILEKIYGREKLVCPAGCHPFPKKKLQFKSCWQGEMMINGTKVKKPYVLLTNRHFPQKKFEWMIEAMEPVWADFPEIDLVITGQETGYTSSLKESLAEKGKNSQKVKFLGLVSEKDLERLYQQAAVYVYSSPEEDFGLGVVEAMAAGRPVVAWQAGGPGRTVIEGQTGFLIEPYDRGRFGLKIKKLLKEKALNKRLGRAGWKRVKRDFSYLKHNQILERALLAARQENDSL